jgi:hypothetical protein
MHVRETTTDGDLYDPHEPGKFIVDCSCGDTYLVDKPAKFEDEFDALEAARTQHIAGHEQPRLAAARGALRSRATYRSAHGARCGSPGALCK